MFTPALSSKKSMPSPGVSVYRTFKIQLFREQKNQYRLFRADDSGFNFIFYNQPYIHITYWTQVQITKSADSQFNNKSISKENINIVK